MTIPDLLNKLTEQYNTPVFIENDPVQFPRRFTQLQDIEIVAVLVSVISWGRRSMILRNAETMLQEMGYNPFDYIKAGKFRQGNESLHRTFKWNDFADICYSLKSFYQSNSSLEILFSNNKKELCLDKYKEKFPNKHISSWNKGSASKRIHLFLKWMIRKDNIVDIGCWKNIDPAHLYIPLDTHVARNARDWGLLTRKNNDRKAVEELTDNLQQYCPEDPTKYDFALFASSVTKI